MNSLTEIEIQVLNEALDDEYLAWIQLFEQLDILLRQWLGHIQHQENKI